jgi:Cof subfamily protein (haloacid dehalogenase superfamily)
MNLQTIKAIAIDVDGTLLDSDHQLRGEVKEALGKLAASDVQVILATARGPEALSPVLRLLDLTPLVVCFSGAWAGEIDHLSLIPKRVLLDRRHSLSTANLILTEALALKVEPNVFTLGAWRVRKMTPEVMLECKITEATPIVTSDLLAGGEEPSKILLITAENEPFQPLHIIANSIRAVSNAAFSKPNYLEIVPFGVNKAEALMHLTAILGFQLSQVAAIGDGLNDIEMIKEAGLGIAMGNAEEAVKSAAAWVTGTNNQAGVAQAVRKLFTDGLI